MVECSLAYINCAELPTTSHAHTLSLDVFLELANGSLIIYEAVRWVRMI